MWVVVAKSCHNCDEMGAAVYDHEPTQKDIYELVDSLGGLCCIVVKVFEGELNEAARFVEEKE